MCENLGVRRSEVGLDKEKRVELAGVVITGYVSAMRICTRPLRQDRGYEDDHISNFSHWST